MIELRTAERQLMEAEVQFHAPREACGFLAGRSGRVEWVVPVANIAPTPGRFRMDPQAQVRALHAMDERGLDLIGIYHSHPDGPDHPSAIDQHEAAYPDAVQLIWFRRGGGWACRAFRFQGESMEEVAIEVTPG